MSPFDDAPKFPPHLAAVIAELNKQIQPRALQPNVTLYGYTRSQETPSAQEPSPPKASCVATKFLMSILGLLVTILIGAVLGSGMLFSVATLNPTCGVVVSEATLLAASFLGVFVVTITNSDRTFKNKYFPKS